MKTKLFLLFTFFSSLSYAQVPISSYFTGSTAPSVYDIVTSSVPLDQAASGTNLVWNFNQLTRVGESFDYISTPTVSEITTYPNSTTVIDVSSIINTGNTVSTIYYSKAANALSITALKNTDLELNYITNNATVGLFPMSYGYSNTDTTAGTYVYGMYLGTFTGTITTSFESYGTLNMNDAGNGPFNNTVSRLKTVQNISLNYGVLNNVGTAIQTTYNYYDSTNGSNNLIFRNTTVTINVPLLSISQTTSQIERFVTMLLGTEETELLSNEIQIIPNPVDDVLHIKSNQKINSVSISDINGRAILNSDYSENTLNISHLQKGIYFATIETDLGIITKKIVKK